MRYLVCCVLVALTQMAAAQVTTQVVGPNGQVMTVTAASPADATNVSVAQPPGGENPKADSSKGEKKEGDDQGSKNPGESPEPKVIRRDQMGDSKADPGELKATVGEDGRVAFQFRNQAWEELIQWLADISDQPLDWLELPGDRVNLRSPGRYTVPETRDLFNRYLLARGYTLLELDGGMTVAKTENINPAIVPRVDVDQLNSLQPNSFVRVSLDVGWLSAQKLAEELKPMISTNGKLTALTTTNRIEAMDAAINLQQVAALLVNERNSDSREALAPEFKLRHLPAEEAKLLLEQFLGVEKKKDTPMTPQQMQMMQQMQQQNQGKGAPPEPKEEISIVANVRQNSVLIRAPIDRVTIAFKFLERVDVARDVTFSLADVQSSMDVIRLETLDPEKLIEIVREMNVLEPTTRIRVDKDNNAIIVSGSPADRFIIKSVVERLDGNGRRVYVMQLRHLPPTEVADSISFLMGQEQEDDSSKNSRRSYYYGYYGGDEEEKKEEDKFRVAANSRSRQIMLWANEQEMEQVESLLIKLGELPPPDGSDRTIRVIDASATPETYQYLQRLRRQWGQMSTNPLVLPEEKQFRDDEKSQATPTDEDANSENEKSPATNTPVKPLPSDADVARRDESSRLQLTAAQSSTDEFEVAENDTQESDRIEIRSAEDFDRLFGKIQDDESQSIPSKAGAPVTIEWDESGNLIILSEDTEALDKLERLMIQVAPPKPPHHTFKIEHASVFMVYLNLKEYFEEEKDNQSEGDSFYRWYFGSDDDDDDKKPSGLGRDDELRFVYDPDTSTIVVRGASTDQLVTIRNLIDQWDIPAREDTSKNRYLDLVPLQYGRAEKIAETVKEALLDLLSSSDKAFRKNNTGQNGNQEKQGRDGEKTGSNLVDSKNGNESGEVDLSFKGKLAIGVDEQGNTLMISAEGESLLKLVKDMIGKLDEAARPSGEVQVMQLNGGIGGDAIESALRSFGASIKSSNKSKTDKADTPAAATTEQTQ